MFGNKIWPAAVIAAGLLIGCGEDQRAESKSTEHQHQGHDHAAPAAPAPAGEHAGHAGHEMPAAAPEASAGHQHGSGHEGHHPAPKSGSAADHSAHSARGGHSEHSAPAGSQTVHEHAGHSQPAQPAAPAHDHSGHSQPAATGKAPEAPLPEQPAKILSPDALDSPAETSVLDARRVESMAQGGSHAGHGGTYTHIDAGRSGTQAPAAEPHQHEHEGKAPAVYVCPMHPEVTSDKPGTCSKCGMTLVERREE